MNCSSRFGQGMLGENKLNKLLLTLCQFGFYCRSLYIYRHNEEKVKAALSQLKRCRATKSLKTESVSATNSSNVPCSITRPPSSTTIFKQTNKSLNRIQISQNLVRIFNCRQPMGNNDKCHFFMRQIVDRPLHQLLGFGVKCTTVSVSLVFLILKPRRLVQNQNPRPAQQSTRNDESLALPARQ